MVALSLVSSVAMGAKAYTEDNGNKEYYYSEYDIKFENNATLDKIAKTFNIKYKYGKDANNVERIIAVLDNNETAIIEHVYLGYNDGIMDVERKFLPEESTLYVIKDSQKGELRHSTKYDNDYYEYYVGRKEENTELKPGYRFDEWDGKYHYPNYKEKRPIDDNATDENSEIRNWFINNANGLQKKVNEESKK